jgi:hypothetical protein
MDPFESVPMSKIALNLHYYGGNTILEIHRIMLIIAQKAIAISPRSNDVWLDKLFEPMVSFYSSNEELVAIIDEILSMPAARIAQIANKRLNYFKRMPSFSENLRSVHSFLIPS